MELALGPASPLGLALPPLAVTNPAEHAAASSNSNGGGGGGSGSGSGQGRGGGADRLVGTCPLALLTDGFVMDMLLMNAAPRKEVYELCSVATVRGYQEP